jgi:hypothetical protein
VGVLVRGLRVRMALLAMVMGGSGMLLGRIVLAHIVVVCSLVMMMRGR